MRRLGVTIGVMGLDGDDDADDVLELKIHSNLLVFFSRSSC